MRGDSRGRGLGERRLLSASALLPATMFVDVFEERVAGLGVSAISPRAPMSQQLEHDFRSAREDFAFFEDLDGFGERGWIGRGADPDPMTSKGLANHVGKQKG